MPYFRDIPMKTILLINFILGLVSGWFFVQGIKLLLGRCVFGGLKMTGICYRVLGVQLSFLVFIIVWLIQQKYWQKNRPKGQPVVLKKTASDYGKAVLTVLAYAAGAAIINLIRLL